MANYRLLRKADNDLAEIADYTLAKYGVEQGRRYRDSLLRAFETISENAEIGSDQSHILPTLRRHVHESHAIYYQIGDNEIVVLRLLGPGQDPLSQFQSERRD